MPSEIKWFFFSALHKEWLKKFASMNGKQFHMSLCRLKSGRIVEYTASEKIGATYINKEFPDYEFLGEGTYHGEK